MKQKIKNTSTLLLLFGLLLSVYSGSSSSYEKAKSGDGISEDSEHQIKDSLVTTKRDSTILSTGWYYVVDTGNVIKRILDKSIDSFLIYPKLIVSAKDFTMLEINENNEGGQKNIVLTMLLDEDGTENWSVATEKATDKQLAFILDNKLIHVAKINAQITVGVATISRSNYTRQELEKFRTIIESER
jgi:preprotein translocase subunit SecD